MYQSHDRQNANRCKCKRECGCKKHRGCQHGHHSSCKKHCRCKHAHHSSCKKHCGCKYHHHCGCKKHRKHHAVSSHCLNHFLRDSTGECLFQTNLNLSGLKDSLNYKLIKNCHRKYTMFTIGGYEIRGKTHDIGVDYVDVKSKDTIITVLKDKIDHIEWT